MSKKTKPVLMAATLLLLWTTGCGTMHANRVGPTDILVAESEIPEGRLLDVGIEVFDPGPLTGKKADKLAQGGSTPKVRKAEAHYMPTHLKHTLEKTGYWGAVRVTPVPTDGVDVSVKGMILESTGEEMHLMVTVRDASGRLWLQNKYYAQAEPTAYTGTERASKDPYQNMYNRIANDMLAHLRGMSLSELGRIQTISEIKFAESLSSTIFKGYLETDSGGRVSIVRLPAEDDPMVERARRIREREYMFIDTLNEYYSDYYDEMWTSYLSWRESNRDEAIALREIRSKARTRKLLGALAIAGAIALEVSGTKNTGTVRDVMVIGGIEAIKSGISVGHEAAMHKEAIQELSDSFGAEMEPQIVDVEGRTTRLAGSAEEQYVQLRKAMKEIYVEELGFDPDENVEIEVQPGEVTPRAELPE